MKNILETEQQDLGPIIKCPNCGWEYVPCEIFMPSDHIGRTKKVIRDALGKILYVEYEEGKEANSSEDYFCDNCGKQFLIDIVTTYKARKQEAELDFSTTETSLL